MTLEQCDALACYSSPLQQPVVNWNPQVDLHQGVNKSVTSLCAVVLIFPLPAIEGSFWGQPPLNGSVLHSTLNSCAWMRYQS